MMHGELLNCKLWTAIALLSSSLSAATVLDLQKDKQDYILDIQASSDSEKKGFIRLINLNPNINTWYFLSVTFPGEKESKQFHLENPDPRRTQVYIDVTYQYGLRIKSGADFFDCPLWQEPFEESELLIAAKSKKTYAPICQDRLYVRNRTEGRESTKEWVADFLRSHVWGGEKLTSLVKDYLYKDKFMLTQDEEKTNKSGPHQVEKGRPLPGLLSAQDSGVPVLEPKGLGISVKGKPETINVGEWYELEESPNIFFSAYQPKYVPADLLETYKNSVLPYDKVEPDAFVFLVGMDLSKFELGFSMGTKHPSPEWSARIRDKVRNEKIPGPDGFETFDPLIMTGKVPPYLSKNVVATFTAGFKRTHGAFKWGKLAEVNSGSHYGYVENGVVLSSLQPGLATLVIYRDGSIALKTWSEVDAKSMDKVVHARQNGVPIVEWDDKNNRPKPGNLVNRWGQGNWSGSAASKQRALRAAACLQESAGSKFLIYAYFSSATPNAMARVFQAYNCRYGLHLDMNALEHTYLAIYRKKNQEFEIEHLITGMNVLDRKVKDHIVPRFVGTADNRDFFYVVPKG